MLRELLLALHGHTGDVFIKEVVEVTPDQNVTLGKSTVLSKLVFKIDPKFSLIHPSERQAYDRLVQLGCYYFQLKEFSDLYSSKVDSYSLYINALKLGFANILEGYEELIVKVEDGFLSGKDFDYGSTTVSYLMGIFTHYRIIFPDLLIFP
ncbi:hypothetical protein DSO57_1021807 [Entomophthora muscae]|uniref:Uncharacterized protein n=1 Tax=Entomophthora muscae TaxID=34485 RepID=A0ACC2U2D0_9FUNG|nr:hypothetical protein DSO57_1021807 [Entomophthora muscae]